MSANKKIEEIILKAKKDEKFKKAMLENPLKTLKDYELTDKEIEFFKNIDEKVIEGLSEKCFKLADKNK